MTRWQPSAHPFGVNTKLALARQAVAINPGAGMAHYRLALELFRLEEMDACLEAFRCAMALLRPTAVQLEIYVKALLAQGHAFEALTVLNDHEDEVGHSPGLLTQKGAVLRALGRHRKAAELLFAAIERDPRNSDTAQAILLVLQETEDWLQLLQFFDDQAQRNTVTIPVVLARIAGLMGLGRTEEAARLLDFDSFVSVGMIDPPSSFQDLSAFNAALASDIAAPGRIKLSDAPRLRLTGGVQVEDLEVGSSTALACLFEIFKHAVDEYIASRSGDCAKLMRQLSPEFANLECWGLMLGRNDTQDTHFHAYSSVAGVYYVAAPEAVFLSDSNDGCLVIPSEHSVASHTLPPGRYLKPIPGRLVLFPGYFPHRTTPIRCEGKRISIAFDTVPQRSSEISDSDHLVSTSGR